MGRDDEMAALDRLLAALDTRMLTLTGPPGVGKTRLAVAAAAAAAARYTDGVAFVDLTDVRDPRLVAPAVLEAAGFGDVAVYARGNAFTVACYKAVALVLPHLFPQRGGVKARVAQVLAVLAVPFVVCVAVAGRLSLLGKGGEDCLGYTVTAVRT